jgi:hypothetical protein
MANGPSAWARRTTNALGPPPHPGIDDVDAPDIATAEPVDPDLAVVAGTCARRGGGSGSSSTRAVIGQDASRWKRRLDGRARELQLQVSEAQRPGGD